MYTVSLYVPILPSTRTVIVSNLSQAGNDLSNREWQLQPSLSGGQWCFSKSFDNTAPIGPAIVPTEVIGEGNGLNIRGFLNGAVMQDSNTDNLIFSVAEVVSFLSQGMTLLPGMW